MEKFDFKRLKVIIVRLQKFMTLKLISAVLTIWFFTSSASIAYEEEIPACARSFCGCRTDIEIDYKTTIVSPDLLPQPDIEVSNPQKVLLGVSDKYGRVAFTLKTTVSPGCVIDGGELTFAKETPTSIEIWKNNISTSNDQTVLGQPYQLGERQGGVNDGRWQEWCTSRQWGSSGKLRVSGNYRAGKKYGTWTEWYCSGKMRSQKEYRNGMKEGPWKEWYENGQINHNGVYYNDKLHGKVSSWYPDGKIESETEFRNGKYYGVRKYYSRNGTIEYMDSKGIIIKKEQRESNH